VAAGGRALFRAFGAAPEARRPGDPLDAYTRRVVGAAAERLRPSCALFAFEQREGRFADFVALAAAAGLGAPSRLGLLLHPVYGPWMSIRAVLLTARPLPPSPPLRDFDPCAGCPAPCADACHGSAIGPRFDVRACARTRRREPACALRCDARRACPVGREHAYAPEAEAHHMRHAGLLAGAC
jgi:epoxyqueuosine reductase QueG